MRLLDLQTQHPNGWPDIVAMIKSRHPEVESTVTDYGWMAQSWAESPQGRPVPLATPRLTRDFQRNRTVSLWLYLEALEGGSSGILAAEAYKALDRAGFPTPGHKDWLKPAAQWKKRDG